VSVLRRGYVEVTPDISGFDQSLKTQLAQQDPGGKAGKQVGGQLNRALKRFNIDPIDVRADPKKALAGIAVAEAKLRELSGSAATVEVKIQTEKALGQLTRFRKSIGDVGEDAAPEFALSFSQRLGPLLAKMPIGGPMSAALVGAGISAAPLLGAAVAGGILGGVGIGGVIGGLSIAAKDTRVKAASDAVGDRLETRLNRAAGAFVKPALDGLNQVQRTIDQIDIEGLLADSAKLVPTIAGGASSAVADLTGSLRGLVGESAGPVREIADGLALIGRSASEGLSSLEDNADEGANALKTLFEVTASATTATFTLVNALTELYGISKQIGGDFVLQTLLKATGAEMDKTGESARRTGAGTFGMSQEMVKAAESAEVLKEKQKALKVEQDKVTASQTALTTTLDRMGGQNTIAARTSTALSTAMDNLYGATIRQADANVAYEASWDSLSGAVKGNKKSLDVHTEAGRTNREALVGLITSTNQAYLADINAGVAIDEARKKHNNRIKSIENESVKLGLNRDKTKDLIGTYGQIPKTRETDLILDGVREVVRALTNLYIYQQALATGRSISSVEQKMRTGSDAGPAKRGGGFRQGGRTGNLPEDAPAGVVHGREFVVNAPTVRRIDRQAPGFLDELHATGQIPGYATGGRVAPVDTSRRWVFEADVGRTRVPSKAEVASKVPLQFGNWPGSPASQRGDSGVWRSILSLIRSTGPMSGSFGNAYRPGDPKWHGSGRAIDWMGFNQDGLAGFLANRRPLELIHRTKNRDYAYTRGRNKGSFNEALMEAHRNHIHIAMANGGVIKEPVAGVGLSSGKSYSFGERGPETVTPGIGSAGTTLIVNIPAGAVIAGKRAAVDLFVGAFDEAKRLKLIP
jgi:hypothetical protein